MTIQENKNTFRVIGTMSGTSLDGLDIACCLFMLDSNQITYRVEFAETYAYTTGWLYTLKQLHAGSAAQLAFTDRALGKWMGQRIKEFIEKYEISDVDFVSSHGHTIFHDPTHGYSFQAGHGSQIAAACNLPVVCDFRSMDIALGGQGAPLVPMGDAKLFSEYDFCLNLGGIANISFDVEGTRKAFDICPANMAMNYLAKKMGMEYDYNGEIAASGTVHDMLLQDLNSLEFYRLTGPKSLGFEWFMQHFEPKLNSYKISVKDQMATVVAHATEKIAQTVSMHAKKETNSTVLVTGGGAFNKFFVTELQNKLNGKANLIIPDENTIKFKEAIIFAMLGLFRWLGKENSLQSVTGSLKDNIGGCVYLI